MLSIWVTQGTELMISMQELRFPSVAQEQKYGTRGQQAVRARSPEFHLIFQGTRIADR